MTLTEQLAATLASLNELETEAGGIREAVHEGIEQARQINAAVRAGQAKIRALDMKIEELRKVAKAQRVAIIEAAKAANENTPPAE